MSNTKGSILLILGCFTMGSMGIFAHYIEHTNSINILLYRYGFTIATLAIAAAIWRIIAPAQASAYFAKNIGAIKRYPLVYVATGIVSALVMATYVFGTLLFSLGLSVVMLYTACIYLPFSEKMVRRYFIPSLPKSSFGAKYYLSSILNLVGLMLIVGSSLVDATLNIVGLACAVSSGFIFSVMMVMVRAIDAKGFDPEHTLISGSIIGFLLLLPMGFLLPISFSPHNLWAATGLGSFATAIGGILYFKGFNAVRSDLAPLLAYFEPLFGSFLALMFLGEHYAPIAIAGVLVIVGTNFTYTLYSNRQLTAIRIKSNLDKR